ncbi:helix-turn-helix domain-containing protein [Streptomyces somaliensis]|uniref:Helix-turn-helix domain-containing protein n=1 Tax=Streptomyces somaliensis (strain ATCC 33201 / DSM 40738 / JCM 12659 / KCTC 9044 / NCTC 11332 / NRRL B-12077 / IP 733) TaxID=1134445 RepID=A0AA44DCC1_STRE0|nr:helix-turn-helix domain-containing protein [Streptomyces somaliensis]NKY13647.1 helix-turn-helix domain-containing protein [Streptomyces somaliensis DSM 40738]
MPANSGDRLRDVRKRRGMTQQGLARESGVSVSLIRKLEQGERYDARLETVRRLAATLRVPTSRLVADAVEEGASAAVLDAWAPVREALTAPVGDAAELDEPPTVQGMRAALGAAVPLFSGDRFAELRAVLPALLRDADVLAGLDPEGRALRVRLLQLTGWLLTQTRQFEAAEWSLGAALEGSADRLQGASTVNTMCWLLLRQGRLGEARALAVRWADETEPRLSRATPDELSAWGWLLLRLSAAAVRDNRPGEAEDALRLSHAAAVALGGEFAPDGDFLRAFGPVTVALKRTENAMVMDRPDVVLELTARIPAGGMRPTSDNRNRHLLDVANAYTMTRQYGPAVETLAAIRDAAPQWLPNQRYARDILGRIVAGRRTLTESMRSLADTVGLPV